MSGARPSFAMPLPSDVSPIMPCGPGAPGGTVGNSVRGPIVRAVEASEGARAVKDRLGVTKSDAERMQACLRRLLVTERIRVIAPRRAGMNVGVAASDEVISTLHREVEDDEVSYPVHLTILEEDLLPAVRPTPPVSSAPKRKR